MTLAQELLRVPLHERDGAQADIRLFSVRYLPARKVLRVQMALKEQLALTVPRELQVQSVQPALQVLLVQRVKQDPRVFKVLQGQ
jgi:hypothetical protein